MKLVPLVAPIIQEVLIVDWGGLDVDLKLTVSRISSLLVIVRRDLTRELGAANTAEPLGLRILNVCEWIDPFPN